MICILWRGKLLKENKEIKQTLEEKTSQLETADVRKTHALEDLYVITRSLDVATVEVRACILYLRYTD